RLHRIDEHLRRVKTDKHHLAGLARILQSRKHSGRGRFVRTENSLHVVAKSIEQIFRSTLRRISRRTGVLISRDQFDVRILLLHLLKKASLALFSTRRPFRITQQNHFAFSAQQFAEAIRAQHSALALVGRDKADYRLRLEGRINYYRRDPRGLSFFDWSHERAIVERRQDDPADALRSESFDYLNLLLAIVFAQGAFPDHFHLGARRREFARSLDSSGMDALPKLVRRPF